jgi:L-lactate utilization protein LutC
MKIPEAIQVLRNHQAWRLGAECSQTNPKRITEAIYVILEKVEQTSAIDWDKLEEKLYAEVLKKKISLAQLFTWFKKEIEQ